MSEHEVHAEVIAERRHLMALAFRMLGTVAEAEDAVQETYGRWYRMSREQRDAVEVPGAWLTRTASRVCLDVLGSRRRRERYVGPWLPEPVPRHAFTDPGADDPADRVTLDDSISTALLVVLERMTPAERVAFVLHDVFAMPFREIAEVVGRTPAACRQLAGSARQRVHRSRDTKARSSPSGSAGTSWPPAGRRSPTHSPRCCAARESLRWPPGRCTSTSAAEPSRWTTGPPSATTG